MINSRNHEIGFEPIRKIELVRELKTADRKTAFGAGETVVVTFDLDSAVTVTHKDGRRVVASLRELQRPERPSERAMRESEPDPFSDVPFEATS